MGELKVLFKHIDEPGIENIDVYERVGGYERRSHINVMLIVAHDRRSFLSASPR